MSTYPEHIWEKAGLPRPPVNIRKLYQEQAAREKEVAAATLEMVITFLWNHSPDDGETPEEYHQRLIKEVAGIKDGVGLVAFTLPEGY